MHGGAGKHNYNSTLQPDLFTNKVNIWNDVVECVCGAVMRNTSENGESPYYI